MRDSTIRKILLIPTGYSYTIQKYILSSKQKWYSTFPIKFKTVWWQTLRRDFADDALSITSVIM